MSQQQPKEEAPVAVQATLPYLELTTVAIRQQWREHPIAKRANDTYYYPHDKIDFRPGFNARIKPDNLTQEQWEDMPTELNIPELVEQLLRDGQQEAIEGDLDLTTNIFWITEGYRRWIAIGRILAAGHTTWPNGKPINEVWVIPNPKGMTEKERVLRMLSTNNKLKFKPIETAKKVLFLKTQWGMTSEGIASDMRKSRQWVDGMINLAMEPESIQKAIQEGNITPTAATKLRETVKDPAQREKIVKDTIDAGGSLKVKDIASKLQEETAKLIKIVVDQWKDEIITKDAALQEVEKIRANLKKSPPEGMEIDFIVDELSKELRDIPPTQEGAEGKATGPVKVETQAAIDAEEQSRKTDPNFKETRKKDDREDALEAKSFKKDKEIAEFNLNEVIKLLDKLEVKIGKLPANLGKNRDDLSGLTNFIRTKVQETIPIIKSAPDKGV